MRTQPGRLPARRETKRSATLELWQKAPVNAPRTMHQRRRQAIAPLMGMAAAITLALLNAGCRHETPQGSGPKGSGSAPPAAAPSADKQQELKQQQQQRIGHAATLRCLRGERGTTDGDELRCEDWRYVIGNYAIANGN
ncbi:MAG: hypothetical protein FJ078_02085 [Cyanobacteria bacterium K_DeepCast_35m_m2_155]|nr:hypothetical protein [Cyanobacteria bacterium K_DeepCast_35m_m2_155]